METNKFITQGLRKAVSDEYAMAEKYYSILSVVNDLHMTQREVQLVAFTAVKGNMSYAYIREEFCKKHDTTPPTINNIISRLKKIGVLIKEKGKVKVNPDILLNFNGSAVGLKILLTTASNG